VGSTPTFSAMKRYMITVYIETDNSLKDIENSIKSLNLKGVETIVSQDITTNYCMCKNEDYIDWDAFGGGICRVCGGHTF
jgi:hypothetical protein